MLLPIVAALSATAQLLPPAQPRPSIALSSQGDDWRYSAVTPGSWSWQSTAARSIAQFGSGAALVRLSCDRQRRIMRLSLAASSGQAASLVVRTTSLARTLAGVRPAGGQTVEAEMTAYDPLLDAIAFSRGRFRIELAGSAPLLLPAAPEAARTVEDCRN